MSPLSESDRRMAKMAALITLTDNATRLLADRAESTDAENKAVTALISVERASDLPIAVGSRRLSLLLQAMRGADFPTGEYELFRDILICTAGESPYPTYAVGSMAGIYSAISSSRNH